jgi:probable O-glycosylation ligase (exosortase A-associated)
MYRKTEINNTRERVKSKGFSIVKKESFIPLFLLFTYLVLEYGRPQELLPFLRVLSLPTITVVLLAISIVNSGKIRLKEKQTTLFLFLMGFMIVHGPIAVNNYWTLMIFITMVMNFIVFLSLIHCVDDQEKYKRLVTLWLGIHLFLAIVGIVKKGTGVGGFLADENDFCLAMNMVIPFSFFLFLYSSGKKRMYYISLTCLFLFVIILTGSRGGFVGLLAISAYCWLRSKRKLLTLLAICILVVFAVLVAPRTYWDRIQSITEEGTSEGSGEERIYTWDIAWHMFLDNPIMGVGQGNFPWVFKKYEFKVTGSDEPLHGRSRAGRAAHSIYFTLLPELGIIGTCIFLGMIIYTFKDLKAIRARLSNRKHPVPKPLSDKYLSYVMALEGALISYLISGAFISALYYPNLWILMGFIISLKKIVIPDSNPATA